MSFSSGKLKQQLRSLESGADRPVRYVVALSGGLDSTVLLHSLVSAGLDIPIVAIHVDHGLQPESQEWLRHCEEIARTLGIEFQGLQVDVKTDTGDGPEAAARDARYAALESQMQKGDWLLSAHHQQDQAETLLLNLMRASGPAGTAGIAGIRRFGPGFLVRPLLDISRDELESYAQTEGVDWIEDPSNRSLDFNRNFLRHEILDAFETRWPGSAARMAQTSKLSSEAAVMLEQLAQLDLQHAGGDASRLALDAILDLDEPRRRNLLRFSIRSLGLPVPGHRQLQSLHDSVLLAKEDAAPVFSLPGLDVRRYRNTVYVSSGIPAVDTDLSVSFKDNVARLGPGLGQLQLAQDDKTGLAPELVKQGLHVSLRKGGEQICPHGSGKTRKLKKLLQEQGVVPWMRDQLPLIYCGDQLVAVADLWLAGDCVSRPGFRLQWLEHPPLH